MDRIIQFFKSINYQHLLTNKFLVVGTIFVVWMTFFDEYNWMDLVNYRAECNQLEKEKSFYQNEIAELNERTENILTNDRQLEKFAREEFFMKRDNEDVFIVEEE